MKAHFIAIGGIGISAIARYYRSLGYSISGSDRVDSPLIHSLREEWMNITIGHSEENVPTDAEFVVYSEAIITKPEQGKLNPEYQKAFSLGIKIASYPEALAEIVNKKRCIAIAGSHGKSTTAAMLGVVLAKSTIGGSTIVGTQVPQLRNSNFYFEDSPNFAIEACEYRRSFLRYFPSISIITNIDLDHLDYYRDLPDYMSAFEAFQSQTKDFMVLNGVCQNSLSLKNENKKQLWAYENYYLDEHGGRHEYPEFSLQIPGKHIELDAKMVYITAQLLWLEKEYIVQKLNSYTGCWRRSEIVRTTKNGNILISDYGHHPGEIAPTLEAIKEKYKEYDLFVIFQPHQHSRTRELLEGFTTSFEKANHLIIPNIYFSRDKQEDVEYMTTDRFVTRLRQNYPHIINGLWLENTLKEIQNYDNAHKNKAVFLLLGAGDVDNLRTSIL